MNSDEKNNKDIISIKNETFLNSKNNKLKKNLDMEKIVLIVYEIMEVILYLQYDIDFLIFLDYDSRNNSYDFDDINIIDPRQFNQIDPFYQQQPIDKGYFELHNQKNKINLGESTHKLLKEKEEDNIVNEVHEENNKLKGKRNNIKKIETKEKLKISEEQNEENIDELNSNEKMHNISHNLQKLKNKENKDDIILINKNTSLNNYINNKNDENIIKEINEEIKDKPNIQNLEINQDYKIYFFNENQTIINLLKYKRESIKPVGLINPSIYCFMICILQSLLCIPELNFFFLSKIYLISIQNNNPNDLNYEETNSENNYPVCTSFQHFIKKYLISKKNYIQIPNNLFRICNRLLGGMHMHDSQEFFVCFLEALQDELNISKKNKNKEQPKIIKKEDESTMEKKWNEYRIQNNSFIDSLFTGLMRSTVECKSCKHRSITYDPFIDLNLSINKYKNLEKCLKQYFENEKIDCDYKCDNCKQISKVSIKNI